MEVKHVFVPFGSGLHLSVWLVSDAMINELELWLWQHLVEWFLEEVVLESWEEHTLILASLNESMCSVSVCPYSSHDDRTVLILQLVWFHNWFSTSFNCFLENTCCIIDSEGNILDSVTVLLVLLVPLLMSLWV